MVTAHSALSAGTFSVEPVVVEMSFDYGFNNATVLAEEGAPAWIANCEQQGGKFIDEPSGWQVDATQRDGVGRLTLSIDREKMKRHR